MSRIILFPLLAFALLGLVGCANVPLAPKSEDQARKEFAPPPADRAGLYIYRNTNFGGALKKTVSMDGQVIGETGPMTYFYLEIAPGTHELATESEFGDNTMSLDARAGANYFVKQVMKLGMIGGGARLELVPEEEGRRGVLECELAR